MVARLLTAGADPLVERNDGRTPLHSALRYDAVRGVISVLVQAGAADNLTPLQLAALQDDAGAVTSLLAEGADPNVVDAYGWSSLHFAVPLSGSGVVSALLEAGADPNTRTVDGVTALHLAARQGTSAVVSDLLGAGADPNAATGEEEEAGAALHLATRWSDDPSVVLALLNGGADAAARDENGRRPVDFARGNDAMIGSAAYPRLLVTRPTALVAGRAATGNLQSSDGVGVTEYLRLLRRVDLFRRDRPARRDHHGLGRRGRLPGGLAGRRKPKSRATTTEEPTITLAWNSGHARLNNIQYLQRASSPKRRAGM